MTWQALAQERHEVASLVTLAALALVSAEGQLTEERLAEEEALNPNSTFVVNSLQSIQPPDTATHGCPHLSS